MINGRYHERPPPPTTGSLQYDLGGQNYEIIMYTLFIDHDL